VASAYLTRDEANAAHGGAVGHLYQGDLLQALSFMIPLPDGVWEDKQWDGIVVSHDCEYTKIADRPTKPLLVAPVRKMSDYSQPEVIRAGGQYALWALPKESPIDDDEYVVDFRLIQPMAVRQLQEATHLTCLGAEVREEFCARVELFLFRGQLGR
jgi:hypothetical protein